jgi:hypothetical protein
LNLKLSVRHHAEEKCAQRPHCQGKEECGGNRWNIGFEFLRDVLQDEDNDKEIERVESPTEEARQDRVFADLASDLLNRLESAWDLFAYTTFPSYAMLDQAQGGIPNRSLYSREGSKEEIARLKIGHNRNNRCGQLDFFRLAGYIYC